MNTHQLMGYRPVEKEPIQISTFVPNSDNYIQSEDNLTGTFRLTSGETLVILGEYVLEVVTGSIALYGATLTKESGRQTIYAPSTGPLPVIECNRFKGKAEGRDQRFDAEIIVADLNSGLRDIGKIFPLFKSIWTPAGTKSKGTEETVSFFPVRLSALNHRQLLTTRVVVLHHLPRPYNKHLTQF
jgi:hypothetical protein